MREAGHFAAAIAERGWAAWWRDTEVTLAAYRARIEALAQGPGIPFALVARERETYRGSVLVIESDLAARPAYTPWIAALWVEPACRRRGLGTALVDSARTRARQAGADTCYLCASAAITPWYRARGFRLIETNVDRLNVLAI